MASLGELMTMESKAEHEFWSMIEELASGEERILERAVYTNKRWAPLEPEDVPEALRSEFRQLKSSAENAQGMSEDGARNFVRSILSFYGRLRGSDA